MEGWLLSAPMFWRIAGAVVAVLAVGAGIFAAANYWQGTQHSANRALSTRTHSPPQSQTRGAGNRISRSWTCWRPHDRQHEGPGHRGRTGRRSRIEWSPDAWGHHFTSGSPARRGHPWADRHAGVRSPGERTRRVEV